jgi:poly(3-hydroxybutyrate) depolymerase
MAPVADGSFDLNDYIDYIIDICHLFKGDAHLLSVCQPSVPVVAAVGWMEAADDPFVPRSMTLMGGPVDTRINPTGVNKLAQKRGTDWFRRNVITTTPWPNPGHGRRVYPGFLQLTGFMTMNLDRHVKAHKDLFLNLVKGDGDSVEKHRDFYDEYLVVMDLTAEFYLQTVDSVFVKHCLPRGEFVHRDDRVDLGAVRRVALMTIEGENDDITGAGQCASTHDLCHNLPSGKRLNYLQPEVGHYGIFNGSRFRAEIAPRVAAFVAKHDIRDHPVRRALALISSSLNRPQPAPEPLPFQPSAPAVITPQTAALLRKMDAAGSIPGKGAAKGSLAVGGPQPTFLGRIGARQLWRTKKGAAAQRARLMKKKKS